MSLLTILLRTAEIKACDEGEEGLSGGHPPPGKAAPVKMFNDDILVGLFLGFFINDNKQIFPPSTMNPMKKCN